MNSITKNALKFLVLLPPPPKFKRVLVSLAVYILKIEKGKWIEKWKAKYSKFTTNILFLIKKIKSDFFKVKEK